MYAMAGVVNEVNEGAQDTWTANESVQVAQEACQGDTREHEGHIPKEGGGVLLWAVKKYQQWHSLLSWAVNKYRQWCSRPVSQCLYIDGDPNITSYEVIYKSVIERSSKNPYRFKFEDPTHIITGIACLPKDAKTSSPEVEVVSGGVRFKEVEIVLTPVEKGDWCCCVHIIGIAENRLEMNSVSKELTM